MESGIYKKVLFLAFAVSFIFLANHGHTALNAGFLIMSFGTLFLAGPVQLGYTTSAAGGVWYARSPEFFNSPAFQLLGSFRIIPDTLIIVFGALPLLYFMVTTIKKRRII